MTGPPDDLEPPSVPPAPEFDVPEAEPDLVLHVDTPASPGPPIVTRTRTPWYQGVGVAAVGLVVAAVLAGVVLSRTSGPSPAEEAAALPVEGPAVVEPGPLAAAPLTEQVVRELDPLASVSTTRPQFVPADAPVIEVEGGRAAGTVSRPDGAWMRVTLAPGTYTFRVSAAADTELHLSDVFNEVTFNDDTDGLNPVITENLIGGDYYLWLHIHDRAQVDTTSFTLTVTGPN